MTARNIDTVRISTPRFLLLYSALQFAPGEMAKPDGSLSLPYLAGALRDAKYDVMLLDASVGGPEDSLAETFLAPTPLPSGLWRCGLSRERIAEYMAGVDVVGVSSIFTAQTTMVLELARLAKEVNPEMLVLAGGVNARSLRERFFASGVDVIALSEAERTIVQIAEAIRGKRRLSEVPGIAFLDEHGREVINPSQLPIENLDALPLPAWDLLPLEKYWTLSRPHGGRFAAGETIRYASLQTSRGCPFQCLYCHISKETTEDISGGVGRFRVKSIDRVVSELEILKGLGAEYVFFEDDSLFAKKKRAYDLFGLAAASNLKLLDVNGINICHLLKNRGGRLDLDVEFLDVLAAAGFTTLTLPFESANQRLIDKYASSKWSLDKTDVPALISACAKRNIQTSGNYMIGYPDETVEEIYHTIATAKRNMNAGLSQCHFFTVVPFPGTRLFDDAITTGQLDRDFNPDDMKWTKSMLKNLAMPAAALEHVRQVAWLTVNRNDLVDYKCGMRVAEPSQPHVSRPLEPAGRQHRQSIGTTHSAIPL